MDNDRLAEVESQNALLQLDLEWERERQGFLFRGAEPSRLMFMTPIVVTAVFALVMFALHFKAEANSVVFILVALLLLSAGVIGTAYHHSKYSAFTRAKDRYCQRRTAIEQRPPEGEPSDDQSGGRS